MIMKNELQKEKNMKSKRILLLSVLLAALPLLKLPGMAAESESNYGHVSFVEDQAVVIRSDLAEHKAVVNLPLVPGDTVVTGENGRCELQFDNGTVIRLDKNSRLGLTTMQAPSLTSSWKVSTLHLLQGQMYTLPQTYNEELFQVITPNAAVKLRTRTAATIRFNADLGTTLFSDGGKFEVLYGADSQSLNTAKVKSGQAYVIDTANTLAVSNEKRNLEFVAWNEYVDRHFKGLHSGISKLPPKLEFGNSALQYWAMKWSPFFGDWIYDDLFGYVWRPASDLFARFDRPFFDADYVRINGRLFLVPQEDWAWVPAHMGTWVWLKRGWTWVPGDWFHSGVVEFFAQNGCFFPTFDYYFMYMYGGFDLYSIYYRYGRRAWQENYYQQFHGENQRPPLDDLLDDLPDGLRKIFKRIDKSPLNVVAELLKAGLAQSGLEAKKTLIQAEWSPASALPDKGLGGSAPAAGTENPSPATAPDAENKHRAGGESKKSSGRDWNPDSRWADARGYSIHYSSSRNAVICPELNISSDRGTWQRRAGEDHRAAPGRGAIPESYPQSGNPSSGIVEGSTPATSQDKKSEEKDNSGK